MRLPGFFVVALVLLPVPAVAHSRLTVPAARSTDDNLMAAPCGGLQPGERTTLEAGSATTLEWAVSQSHGASFRIAFSPTADEGFEGGVLGSRPDAPGELSYTQEIKLPACTCDDCTLQLLQYSSPTMLEAYYSCADIELVQPSDGALPPCEASGGSSSGGAGTTGGDASSGGTTEDGSSTSNATTTLGSASTTGDPPPKSDGSSGAATGTGDTDIDIDTTGAAQQPNKEGGCGCTTTPTAKPLVLLLLVLGSARRPKRSAAASGGY